MAHGVSEVLDESSSAVKMMVKRPQQQQQQSLRKSVGVMGSRRIFSPEFKLQVLDSYRSDPDCQGNQRATSRKYNIHRRQIQKWLQIENTLRRNFHKTNPTNNSSSSSSSNDNSGDVSNKNMLNASLPLSPPLSSPASSTSSTSSSPPSITTNHSSHHHQHHHHHHYQKNGASTTASPALNLSLTRLHGDELAIQQRQQQQSHTQQHQPPPPPPPPPPSHSAQVAAAQALAVAATTQASYRFHGAAAAATAAAAAAHAAALQQPVATATGYPQYKDKLPIHQQQQHYASSVVAPPAALPSADYSILYQPLAPTYQQQTPAPSHHRYTVHYNYQQDLPKSETAPSEYYYQRQEPRHATTLLSEVKTERASPNSAAAATPGPYESASVTAGFHAPTVYPSISSDFERQQQPRIDYLKRERSEEEESIACVDYQQRASSISSTITSSSPSPSYPDHLECMPLSPRDSDRSAASSPDSEMGCANRPDLARRRSFSLNFKLKVLDAFYNDPKVKGNQRATARKYHINRRQVQKWLGQESKLRGVIGLCGSNNRQRLGSLHESSNSCSEEAAVTVAPTTTVPVDLRTPTTTDPGQISPQSTNSYYNCCESSPNGNIYVDSSLTPPYSTPGCSLSGCCSQESPVVNAQSHYCYSPNEFDNGVSMKRPLYTDLCCYPTMPSKKLCHDDMRTNASEDERPVQDTPLCLVKPKKPSTPDFVGSSSSSSSNGQQQQVETTTCSAISSPPAAATVPPQPPATKKDAILFKPYLDNPVSKPIKDETSGLNNNCQSACDLNERKIGYESGFSQPWTIQPQQEQRQLQYFEVPHVRSAFMRYPPAVHYA